MFQPIAPGIRRYLPDLYLVDLDIPVLEGFRNFIGCWVYHTDQLSFVVDPGPTSTIAVLLKALKTLRVEKLDYILLTHIHLDHGGGTGTLLKYFPQAKVNCHPKGIAHLTDPRRLWESSLRVLGKTAEAYGRLEAVPASSVSYQTRIEHKGKQIRVVETPGHASHHICYFLDDVLFAAEVAGVSIPVDNGFYQRIATPARFIYEIYRDSIEKAADLAAPYICLGHYGMRRDGPKFFATALRQLQLWMDVVTDHVTHTTRFDEQKVLEELMKTDPALRLLAKMDKDIRARERYFSLNSIRGIYGYVLHA